MLLQAGATALCCASSHGHGDIVDTLIAAKADVDLCSGVRISMHLKLAIYIVYVLVYDTLLHIFKQMKIFFQCSTNSHHFIVQAKMDTKTLFKH